MQDRAQSNAWMDLDWIDEEWLPNGYYHKVPVDPPGMKVPKGRAQNALGRNFQSWREVLGLTVKELGNFKGVGPTSVRKICNMLVGVDCPLVRDWASMESQKANWESPMQKLKRARRIAKQSFMEGMEIARPSHYSQEELEAAWLVSASRRALDAV